MKADHAQLFRKLPQVGQLLDRAEFAELERRYSRRFVIDLVRAVLEELRAEVRNCQHDEDSLALAIADLGKRVELQLRGVMERSLRSVINATGVILQTNLGRAPLSEAAIQHVADVARGYCNLEVDLDTGERSHRDRHVEQLVVDVLAARSEATKEAVANKAAAVVNNCAAACFLALNTLAEGGEVIVSRGELIEIGGGFRVPDILRKSGAVLREVGTTNRTRISDYANAITPETRLILRVHRSNFRMEGFTERPALAELRDLGERVSVPVFEDQGTGSIVDVQDVWTSDELSWVDSVATNIALVACSGDKLLGGPQCGILVGSKIQIDRIRANPLFRAMRVDKMTYAALESTLLAYLSGTEEGLPAIAMMRLSSNVIKERCVAMADAVRCDSVSVDVVGTRSVVGGGTTPGASLPSFAVALRHKQVSESALGVHLRNLRPAVMTRSQDGCVLLDLRTVQPAEDAQLCRLVKESIATLKKSEQA